MYVVHKPWPRFSFLDDLHKTDNSLSSLRVLLNGRGKMLLRFLLLKILLLCLFSTGLDADAADPPMEEMEVSEKSMESRLRDLEARMKQEEEKHTREKEALESLIRDLETRLVLREDELETRLGNLASAMKEEKATVSKLMKELERKENASSTALTKSSPPILFIAVWRSANITSPQVVTFESFLANYFNHALGEFDLDSGKFFCITPGYYTVSFSAYSKSHGGTIESDYRQSLFLYKNDLQLPESYWTFGDALNSDLISVTASRILVSMASHISKM